ncbi:MAG: glycyl radical protein [Planctomycetota bacterium]
MTERVRRLREASIEARPSISPERAQLMTRFYRENAGKHAAPVLRALAFKHLCEHKTIWIGEGELIVGERGPRPAATPTYPELTCHSVDDLQILKSREKTRYAVPPECLTIYEEEVIPYWRGRTLRDRIFAAMTPEWHAAYAAGVFTEFMEQRAPGHTVADGKIYRCGMREFQRRIKERLARLDCVNDPRAHEQAEQLRAMHIAAEAAILFARRHTELARKLAAEEQNAERRRELERIAAVCERVPAEAPRDFHEALQMYWFCHLGVITELNGWDAFNPGHLDQHLWPFYEQGLADGTLMRESAKELLECWWIKFNNHPAPPKVGVTAAESGTYTDFANINLGGLTRDGRDAVNEVSYLLLEIIDEMHILQPSTNVQISRVTPERFLKEACRVIRKGYGFPSVFNADAVVAELLRQGKSVEDAREGGTSGCVETGAFGKEAYILTGYFNLVKILEITLNNGRDPRTRTDAAPDGKQFGPETGDLVTFTSFDKLFAAWRAQVQHFVDVKIRGNHVIERLYAEHAPAPFLSLLTDDCIQKGQDYNAGGARYNTSYIQGVGIGTLTDSFAAIRKHVFGEAGGGDFLRDLLKQAISMADQQQADAEAIMKDALRQKYGAGAEIDARLDRLTGEWRITVNGDRVRAPLDPKSISAQLAREARRDIITSARDAERTGRVRMAELLEALRVDFEGHEELHQRLLNKSPKYGNDDDAADELMRACFDVFFEAVDGRPNGRGGTYHIDMLPTTCHVYFGSVTGATPDGRRAGTPLSEGISPVQGADRLGPTAVFKSAGKMDHIKTGGTLLNQKFAPQLLAGEDGLEKLGHLIRTYFRMNGHHAQFNVVSAETLRAAQKDPGGHRHLIVRVAGYSDYFVDLSTTLQEEIIARTEQQAL